MYDSINKTKDKKEVYFLNNLLKGFLVILLIIWVIITFVFSGQEGAKSTVTSQGVIKTLMDTIPSTKNLNDNEKKELLEKWKKPVRKLAHYTIYLIGGILIYAVVNMFNIALSIKIIYSQVAGTIFAIIDEIHQTFVPGRSGQVYDVCIDSLGILTGIMIMILIIQVYNSINRRINV